jgi:hypothetical protein
MADETSPCKRCEKETPVDDLTPIWTEQDWDLKGLEEWEVTILVCPVCLSEWNKELDDSAKAQT